MGVAMSPATWPRDDVLSERLLTIDPQSGAVRDRRVVELGSMLRPGDLLVVNDAATFPASLQAWTSDRQPIEVRLLPRDNDAAWTAVLFGAGDWRTPTEHRPPPPRLRAGDRIVFDDTIQATVRDVDSRTPRRVRLAFNSSDDTIWPAIYRLGKPVQYAYVKDTLALFHVQTRYGSRPWAAELPSAGRPLTWGTLLDARARGVEIATLTHATGLSSTGDAELDAVMPWPERFEIPRETVEAVARARRVIAVGTSVVRALEGCAARHDGRLAAEMAQTDLVVRAGFHPTIVDGILTGIHDRGATHFDMLHAFADDSLLLRAHAHAERAGYSCHEFGDSCLILSDSPSVPRPA